MKIKNKKNEEGQAMVLTAIVLTAFLSLLALLMDTGRIYIEHAKLQKIADTITLSSVMDLPDADKAEETAKTVVDFYNLDPNQYVLQFGSINNNNGNLNLSSVTITETMITRLASIFGYKEWTMVVQSAARTGPISSITNWIPIGVNTTDIKLYQRYKLTNVTHTSANEKDIKLMYVPIDVGNIRTNISNDVSSLLKAKTRVNIFTTNKALDICNGFDDRIKGRTGKKGCFKENETITVDNDPNNLGKNVRRDWHFGSDPRLAFVPFVVKESSTPANQYTINGFGLFYIEYAHYTDKAYGSGQPMTEIIGYFVKFVSEGQIDDTLPDFGVNGVEYVDLNKLP